MKHAYKITREDSSVAADKEVTAQDLKFNGAALIFFEEIMTRVLERGAQKAVITIERIVVDD